MRAAAAPPVAPVATGAAERSAPGLQASSAGQRCGPVTSSGLARDGRWHATRRAAGWWRSEIAMRGLRDLDRETGRGLQTRARMSPRPGPQRLPAALLEHADNAARRRGDGQTTHQRRPAHAASDATPGCRHQRSSTGCNAQPPHEVPTFTLARGARTQVRLWIARDSAPEVSRCRRRAAGVRGVARACRTARGRPPALLPARSSGR